MSERSYVTGLFSDVEAARQGVEALIEERFTPDEIGVLVRDEGGVAEAPVEHRTGVEAGVKAGGGLGATLGALGGSLVSVGALPALGLGLVASGPIAAAATASVAGAAGGGLLGALAGLGFWTEAPELPDELERGAVLVSVPASEKRRPSARRALEAAGARWVRGEAEPARLSA